VDGRNELDDVVIGSIDSGQYVVFTDAATAELVEVAVEKTEDNDVLEATDLVLVACVVDGDSRMVTDTVVSTTGGGL